MSPAPPTLYLGVDGGGTKTLAVVADGEGTVRGIGRAGGSNFQIVGVAGARSQIEQATAAALAAAGAAAADVAACGYGLAGADREADFATCREILAAVAPCERRALVNDTVLGLRAGTADGVGVGLVAGTSSNCIGRGRDGRRHKVGGLGRLLGDFGGAVAIAEEAVALAMRGRDGRGEPTALHDRIVAALGLGTLEDVVERTFADHLAPDDLGALAPLVFETAAEGDAVALGLLRRAGEEAALCANVVLRALFDPGEPVPIVLMGSLYQRARSEFLIEPLREGLDTAYDRVRLSVLGGEPVLGGVLLALDVDRGHAVDGEPARGDDAGTPAPDAPGALALAERLRLTYTERQLETT